MEKHPLHLKDQNLQKSPEVEKAVEKKERLSGEKLPNDPTDRIESYTERLENIFLNKDERIRERNLELLRDKIYDELIIKPENFPESYFELQKRIAREHGQAVEEIPEDVREQMITTAIEDQRASLDSWIEYLTEEDAAYPAWYKYYVWNQVIKLSQFDKERGEFKKRTKSTVAPYPDIHRDALARILDVYQKVKEDNSNLKEEEIKEAFGKKFPSLYAEYIAESLSSRLENKEEIRGEWRKYRAGNSNEAQALFESVQGKGTGWCVEGSATAKNYLNQGDFYVYYTYDNDNNPTDPRLAIQMNGEHIGQVRGILPHQEVEPILQEVLDEKLEEFGSEADIYKKKSADMKHLTLIEEKTNNNEELTKEDLTFLYEIDTEIEGFGYQKDPRIEEIREKRNKEEDMLTIFECTKEQIAHNPEEITEETKAYVGEWNPQIFQTIKNHSNIEHLYVSFPEKKIFYRTLETNPEIDSPEKAEEMLKEKDIYLSEWGKDILYKTEFSGEKKSYELVRFSVRDLGFKDGATTDEIYQKAQDLGLELCPSEVGPHLRLTYPGKEYFWIAMKQITDRGGYPDVWRLHSDDAGLELFGRIAHPADGWDPGSQFVFLSRKAL